jgi:DNA helicase-2/ATP-dependent DNA helicase PcrA
LYYSNNVTNDEEKYNLIKEKLWWDFEWKPEENKILVLTNKKISDDLWYRWLLDAFEARFWQFWTERLKGKDEAYIDFLLNKVEKLIFHYENKNYSDFFELFWKEDFKIRKLEDRTILKDLILWLKNIRETWFVQDVLSYVFENTILVQTDKILSFESYLWEELIEVDKRERQEKAKTFKESLMGLSYSEIINYNSYIENKTPYSTQHGTKWAEYNNVLLVIDDSHKWWIYKGFDKLVAWKKFNTDEQKHQETKERLLNLLYVSVSRAKEKLVVLYLSPLDTNALSGWNTIFWEENIYELSWP